MLAPDIPKFKTKRGNMFIDIWGLNFLHKINIYFRISLSEFNPKAYFNLWFLILVCLGQYSAHEQNKTDRNITSNYSSNTYIYDIHSDFYLIKNYVHTVLNTSCDVHGLTYISYRIIM